MSKKPNYEFGGKVTCPKCKCFVGIISDDGKTGPLLDDCLGNYKNNCPMMEAMAKFQPRKTIPLGRGIGTTQTSPNKTHDEDSGFGTYYTHGMTAEDQG